MKLTKYLPKVDTSLGNVKDSVFKTFFEFRKSRKYEHNLSCDVILIYPNSLAEKYQGLTDESNALLIIPLLLRAYRELHPIFIEGRKTFFVSSEYHATIDIIKLIKVAESISENFRIDMRYTEKLRKFLRLRWDYDNDIISLNVKNVNGTIDMHLFDNKFSADFSSQAYKIIQTKSLAFLEETSKRVFILSCVISAGIGMAIGAFITVIASILMFLAIK
jgi:hypothetical protein